MAIPQLGPSPSNSVDAATKAYVDTATANLSTVTGFQSVTTAAGTTTLTSSSPMMTQFTGSTTQTCVLPNATTLSVGRQFVLSNRSTGSVQVNMNGGSALQTLFSTSEATLTLTNNSTAAGTWDVVYLTTGGSVGVAATAYVATSESTSSTTYTDLTTTTDSVTVTIGSSGMALIILSAYINPTWVTYTSFAASGANTIAASDTNALIVGGVTSGQNATSELTQLLTGLSPGSTTFKMKYRDSSTSSPFATWANRRITVIPINNTNLWAGLTNNLEGSFSALPAAGTAGRLYTATDTGLTLMDNGSSWDRIYGGPLNRFTASPSTGWSTTGTGTFSVDKDSRLLTKSSTASGSSSWGIEYRSLSPASGYTVTAYIESNFSAVNYNFAGLVLYDSASGKFISWGPTYDTASSASPGVDAYKWASLTAYSGNYSGLSLPNVPNWIRIKDDGTNRYFQYSINGVDWVTHYTVSRVDFITPDSIGWGADFESGTGYTFHVRLRSFNITTP